MENEMTLAESNIRLLWLIEDHRRGVRNWAAEMGRACDALKELGPDFEEAALGNAHVSECLETCDDLLGRSAALIESLRAENRRAWEAYQIAWQQAVENGEALTASNAKVARLEEALRLTRHTVGYLKNGFSRFVEPSRWVEQLQHHIDVALDPQLTVEMNDGG